MKATIKNYQQTPRKVRVVANLIKGKKIQDALIELDFLAKRAAGPVKKLIESAAANAKKNFSIDPETLIVSDVRVDKGMVLKRFMPRARGSASRLNLRFSHLTISLGLPKEKKGSTKTKNK